MNNDRLRNGQPRIVKTALYGWQRPSDIIARTRTVMGASLSPDYTYRDLFFIANSLRVLTRRANPTCMLVHNFFNALSGVEFFDYAKNLESHRRSIFFSSDDWTNSHPVLHIQHGHWTKCYRFSGFWTYFLLLYSLVLGDRSRWRTWTIDGLELDEIKRHSATEVKERDSGSMEGNARKVSEEVKKDYLTIRLRARVFY